VRQTDGQGVKAPAVALVDQNKREMAVRKVEVCWTLTRTAHQSASHRNRVDGRSARRDALNEPGSSATRIATELGSTDRDRNGEGTPRALKHLTNWDVLGRSVTERNGSDRISSAVHSTTLPPLRRRLNRVVASAFLAKGG
jgi:hypothetical protein